MVGLGSVGALAIASLVIVIIIATTKHDKGPDPMPAFRRAANNHLSKMDLKKLKEEIINDLTGPLNLTRTNMENHYMDDNIATIDKRLTSLEGRVTTIQLNNKETHEFEPSLDFYQELMSNMTSLENQVLELEKSSSLP